MRSGWAGQHRFRFDGPHPEPAAALPDSPRPPRRAGPAVLPGCWPPSSGRRDYLLARQAPEGYWVGELEGDTILESEYILLLAYLGQAGSPTARRAANYILKKTAPGGRLGDLSRRTAGSQCLGQGVLGSQAHRACA